MNKSNVINEIFFQKYVRKSSKFPDELSEISISDDSDSGTKVIFIPLGKMQRISETIIEQ